MYGQKETLYDVLELPRNAPTSDVEKAYRRRRGDVERMGANPRYAALLKEAYEVLSDADRRAAYDKSLKRESFLFLPGAARIPWKWVGYGSVLAIAGLVAWLALSPA